MSRPISDHFDGEKFYNIDKVNTNKSFFDLIKWMTSQKSVDWPKWVNDNATPNLASEPLPKNEVRITSINHATHLIQIRDLNILTDPVFSKRVSPFSWIGPKRHRAPGLTIEELPRIDFILISHNHYDHTDIKALSKLIKKDDPIFLVPLGNSELIEDLGSTHIIELDWWQSYDLPRNLGEIFLTPAQHWSNRGIFDRNKALWGGFVIQVDNLKTYFAGDTGYGRHFKLIKEKFGSMDVSIIPIGAYEPRWFMKEQHVNPEEAVQAHIDLNSKQSIGTHFGTFQLTDEGINDPVIKLAEALKSKSLDSRRFLAPKNGETIIFKTAQD